MTSVEMGLMRAGDANNDNRVDVGDFSVARSTFGLEIGNPGYDARADFNGDGTVNIADFNLLRQNFGSGGAPPAGPSGPRQGSGLAPPGCLGTVTAQSAQMQRTNTVSSSLAIRPSRPVTESEDANAI
jgi:hypothetical protein